jgi:hypothetical protein
MDGKRFGLGFVPKYIPDADIESITVVISYMWTIAISSLILPK